MVACPRAMRIFALKPFSESIVRNDSGRLRIFFRVNDIIIKNICIFVIGNGSGRFAATDEKGYREGTMTGTSQKTCHDRKRIYTRGRKSGCDQIRNAVGVILIFEDKHNPVRVNLRERDFLCLLKICFIKKQVSYEKKFTLSGGSFPVDGNRPV